MKRRVVLDEHHPAFHVWRPGTRRRAKRQSGLTDCRPLHSSNCYFALHSDKMVLSGRSSKRGLERSVDSVSFKTDWTTRALDATGVGVTDTPV